MPAYIEGSDDTFIVVLFSFTACICLLLVLEFMLKHKAYTADFYGTTAWLRMITRLVTQEPAKVKLGYRLLKENPDYTKKHIVPLYKRIFTRWRWACWVLCIVLFFAVAYQKLTFDPYQVLGVSPNASMREIKKQYKWWVKLTHPDLNKTEEAKVDLARVKRAWALIKDPDDKDAFNDGMSEQKVTVGVPEWMTNPESAKFAVPVMLLVLFAVPFYALYVMSKRSQPQSTVPLMKSIAENLYQAEAFWALLGQPADPWRPYEKAERARLVAALQKIERAGYFYYPSDEVPLKPSETIATFQPGDLATCVELYDLLADVAHGGSKGRAAEMKLAEVCIHPYTEHAGRALKEMSEPTEEEREKAANYRKEKGSATNIEFVAPTEDEVAVGTFFLDALLFQAMYEAARIYPRTESRPEWAQKLRQILVNRLDHLKLLRRRAGEMGGKIDASTKQNRELLTKCMEYSTQCQKALFDIIQEAKHRYNASKRMYQTQMKKMEKQKHSKSPSARGAAAAGGGGGGCCG